MDALNKKERREAFIKVFLLFVLTVILVAIIMFFAFRMPAQVQTFNSEEYEKLITLNEISRKNDKDFLFLTDSARALYIQYSKENIEVNRGRISNRFSGVLNNMEDIILRVEQDTLRSDLYGHLIDAYSNLFVKNDNINELKLELKKASETTGGAEIVKELSSEEQMIELIKAALEKHNGNKKNAAKEIGMTERRLIRVMKDLGM
ncbi:MAG: type VI secretion system TssO [Mariniphaga sp.]|nr:type VI secretion system TssO [Mariniphaga sp.]